MFTKQYKLLLAVAAVFSMIGSMMSSWIFADSTAFASNKEKTKIIEAQEIRIVDNNGKIRGKFTLLFDEYPALIMRNKDGSTAIALGVSPNGSPSMTFADEKSVRAEFGFMRETAKSQSLGMRLIRKNGKPGVFFGMDSDEIPLSVFTDKRGLPKLTYSVPSSDRPNIVLFSDTGKPIWTAP